MKKPKKKPKPKNEEINFDYMKTNKDNMKNVIKDNTILPIINDLVNRVNKIVIHTYQFLKFYCINKYQNGEILPTIDKNFICNIFQVITTRKCGSGGYTKDNMPDQLKELTKFYEEHYSKTLITTDILYYDKLSYILPYEAIDMITNINNNIQEHFISHLNRYINVIFEVKTKLSTITKNTNDKVLRKELHKQVWDEISKVKKDIITFGDFTSDSKYHAWIKEQKIKLFGIKTAFEKNNIHYDIKVNQQDYLQGMFYINNELEKSNDKIIQENNIRDALNMETIKQIRLFNVLPLRTNIVGKNIIIDTCALISNFLGKESTSQHLKDYKKNDNQYNLWNRFFRLNKKVFKKTSYQFNNMIRTDGISCCILFIRVDANGKPLGKKFNDCSMELNYDYIENIEITDKIKAKKFVVADPGHSDLIYCGSRNIDGKLETFRYTQNQRRLETRNKKYNKIIDSVNKETLMDNKTVKEIETCLSLLNSKTSNYNKFKEYINEKNRLNNVLYNHYKQVFFRKFKLNRFINTQKSESKMIKNFSNKFGTPKDTIFIMGDYDKGSYNMKGLEPSICKRFRRLFKNAGYETYLVNEFRTSKISNCCHTELEKFMEHPSKKPKNNKAVELCHGLLRCQSIKPKCEIIHNRDRNAVHNMLDIVESIITTGKRPSIFTRQDSYTFHDVL